MCGKRQKLIDKDDKNIKLKDIHERDKTTSFLRDELKKISRD